MTMISEAVAAAFEVSQALHGEPATYHRGETSVDITAIPSAAADLMGADLDAGLTLTSEGQGWLVGAADLEDLTPARPQRGDQIRLAAGPLAGRYDVLPEANAQTYRLDPTRQFFEILTKAAPSS